MITGLEQKDVLALTHKTHIIHVILFSYIFCILTCFRFPVTTASIFSVSPVFILTVTISHGEVDK